MDEAARRLLLSARDLIDAALELGAQGASCAHPDEARQDIGTMGDFGAWRCSACGHEEHPNRARDGEAVRELREA
jgi:hypothetical protein